ncbi:hypothetical protein H2248_011571 [Termitomyces sp. 'cryptogamus']|nr:hypothetical protein H2248_011571 [Termitomyces sp. 'cryptogamus']
MRQRSFSRVTALPSTASKFTESASLSMRSIFLDLTSPAKGSNPDITHHSLIFWHIELLFKVLPLLQHRIIDCLFLFFYVLDPEDNARSIPGLVTTRGRFENSALGLSLTRASISSRSLSFLDSAD